MESANGISYPDLVQRPRIVHDFSHRKSNFLKAAGIPDMLSVPGSKITWMANHIEMFYSAKCMKTRLNGETWSIPLKFDKCRHSWFVPYARWVFSSRKRSTALIW